MVNDMYMYLHFAQTTRHPMSKISVACTRLLSDLILYYLVISLTDSTLSIRTTATTRDSDEKGVRTQLCPTVAK
jgi:hypothetical protein